MTQLRPWAAALLAACACTRPAPAPPEAPARRGSPLISDGRERPLDARPTLGAAPGPQVAPTLATLSGVGTLAVWEDGRRGSETDLWAALIDTATNRVGPPFPLVTRAGDQRNPRVACGLTSCFLAWEEGAELVGAPVDLSGRVVTGAKPLAIRGNTSSTQRSAALTFAGEGMTPQYLMAWEEVTGTLHDVKAAFFAPDAGFPLSITVPLETSAGINGENPAVANAETTDQTLVVWDEDGKQVRGQRFKRSTRTSLDGSPFNISQLSGGTGAALGEATATYSTVNGNWRVAWADQRNGDWDVLGATVSTTASVSVSTTSLVVGAAGDQRSPQLAGLAGGAVVYLTWADHRGADWNIWGAGVDNAGAVSANVIVSAPGDQTAPALLGEAHGSVLWVDDRALDGQTDIWAAQVNVPQSTLITPFPVSVAPNEQTAPRAAWSASGHYLTAWEDTRDAGLGSEVYGALLDSDGASDGGVLVLASAPGAQRRPAVATFPGGWLVTWSDAPSRTIRGVKVDAAGAVGPLLDLTVAPTSGRSHVEPALTWASNVNAWWLVAAEVWDAGSQGKLVANRYTELDPNPTAVAVGNTLGTPSHPAIDALGPVVLMAWSERGDIYAQRFSAADGTPLDPFPTAVCTATGNQLSPAIAHSFTQFLVVWSDARAQLPGTAIYGARISPASGLVDRDGVQLTTGASFRRIEPAVAFDGTDWLLVWQDHRDPTAAALFGTHVRPADLAHRAEEPVSVRGAAAPALALESPAAGLLLYQRTESADGGPRAFATRLLGGTGAPCNGDLECQSGSCTLAQCAAPDSGWLGGAVDGGNGGGTDAGNVAPVIVHDAVTTATRGQPYVYNGLGRLRLSAGTLPVTWATCAAPPSGFRVEPITGAVSWTPAEVGTQTVCVTAKNAAADTYTFDVTVKADPSDVPLRAAFSFMPDSRPSPVRIDFTGQGLPADEVVALRWDFGDLSPLEQGTSVQHTYYLPGGYVAELTVFDRSGRSASARQPVLVFDAKGRRPPTAMVHASATHGVGRLDVDFSCDCTAGDKPILFVQFDYGEHASFAPGSYRVRVRAVDASGLSATDSVMIHVDESDSQHAPDCRSSLSPPGGDAPLGVSWLSDYSDPEDAIVDAQVRFDDTTQLPAGARLEVRLDAPGRRRGDLYVGDAHHLSCHDWAEAVALGPDGALPPYIFATPEPVRCGQELVVSPLLAGDAPLEVTALELPPGAELLQSDGRVHWQVPDDYSGSPTLRLQVRNGAGTATWEGHATVSCEKGPLQFSTPCGCSSAGGALIFAALFLFRRRAGRAAGVAALALLACQSTPAEPPAPPAALQQALGPDFTTFTRDRPVGVSANAQFGKTVLALPTLQGGKPGFVVGAPGLGGGAVYGYSGVDRATGKFQLAWLQGDAGPGSQFGSSLALIGRELVVGAPGANGNRGSVLVYGVSNGVATPVQRIDQPLANGRFGEVVLNAGDLTGDGFADLLVGAPGINSAGLFASQRDGGYVAQMAFVATNSSSLSAAVAAGDFNGDGVRDVAVGDPTYGLLVVNGGRVAVWYGRRTGGFDGPTLLNGSTLAGQLGGSLVGLEDATGDGRDELVVGEPFGGGTLTQSGRGYVYPGSDAGLSAMAVFTLAPAELTNNAGFTTSLSTVNSLDNGAGNSLLVGAPTWGSSPHGALFVYVRGNGTMPAAYGLIDLATTPNEQFGAAASGGFDYDDDGMRDLLVGAPGLSGNSGAVYVVWARADAGAGGGGGGGGTGGGSGAGGGGGGGDPNTGGGAAGAGGGANTELRIIDDVLRAAVIGAPWPYNPTGRVTVAGGTRPYTYQTCSNGPVSGVVVDGMTGAVSWTPQGSPGDSTMVCVAAHDAAGQSAELSVEVTLVAPGGTVSAHVAVATDGAHAGDAVSFDGTGSTSVEPLTAWRWDFGDQSPLGSGATVKHVYPRAGGYRVELVAVDKSGRTGRDRAHVQVLDPRGRKPPTAEIVTAGPVDGRDALSVVFDVFTQEGDAPVVSFEWAMSDGSPPETDQRLAHTFSPGRHRVRLTVTDANGLSAYDSVQVTVSAGSEAPPSCRAWVDPFALPVGTRARFSGDWADARASVQQVSVQVRDRELRPPGDPLPLEFQFDDTGPFTGTLKVTNTKGLSCVDFVSGEVFELPQLAPVEGISLRCDPQLSVQLTATGFPTPELSVDSDDLNATVSSGGRLSWKVPAKGDHVLQVTAANLDGVVTREVPVSYTCDEGLEFQTSACGCSSSPPALLLLALALAWRRHRRAR
ncbi:MAG: PKD domain-containing protein [Archangiaceae bacterium]|nr:PKD domain-containing protein [Archangiaceae bacterium]